MVQTGFSHRIVGEGGAGRGWGNARDHYDVSFGLFEVGKGQFGDGENSKKVSLNPKESCPLLPGFSDFHSQTFNFPAFWAKISVEYKILSIGCRNESSN